MDTGDRLLTPGEVAALFRVDPKTVSDRIGHANMNVTFQIYTHRSTGRDREAAQAVADLIHEAMGDTTA